MIPGKDHPELFARLALLNRAGTRCRASKPTGKVGPTAFIAKRGALVQNSHLLGPLPKRNEWGENSPKKISRVEAMNLISAEKMGTRMERVPTKGGRRFLERKKSSSFEMVSE
jgi:hypothetical protein